MIYSFYFINNLMSLQSINKSFKEAVSSQVSEFIQRLQKLYETHDCDFEFSRAQIFETVLNSIIPTQDEPMNNEALSHFLQSTLNNETEKKLKKKYLMKDITQVSSNSKLFGNIESAFLSYSNIRESTISHKSAFSSETPYNKSTNFLQNLLPPEQAVKKEHFSDNSSQKQDSSGSMYNSKSSQTKKNYKLFPTHVKLEIIQYAQNNGLKEASQKYKVSLSKIGTWSRSFSKSKQVRGRKPIDPSMEEQVCNWLKKQLSKGTVLTQKIIREKAKRISRSDQFKASKGWLQKFFKRRPELFEAYTNNRKSGNGPFIFEEGKGEESEIEAKKQDVPLIENILNANQNFKLVKFQDQILKLEE